MDEILETIMELFVEIGIETTGNKKVPKTLRYILIAVILAFYLFVAGLSIMGGIQVTKKNGGVGLFFIVTGLSLLLYIFLKFKRRLKSND